MQHPTSEAKGNTIMTTTTTSTPHPAVVALPAKAVSTEDWQPNDGGRFYRNFQGEIREVVAGRRYGAHAVAVVAHGVQHDDGRLADGTEEFFEAAAISLLTINDEHGWSTDIDVHLSSATARRLADVLVTAADEVDGWSAR
jgi:hypothetical protein